MASITRLLRSGTRFSLTRGYATKTTATTTAKPVDVSAYLQQNFQVCPSPRTAVKTPSVANKAQEPNYAAWGAPSAGSSSSAHFDPVTTLSLSPLQTHSSKPMLIVRTVRKHEKYLRRPGSAGRCDGVLESEGYGAGLLGHRGEIKVCAAAAAPPQPRGLALSGCVTQVITTDDWAEGRGKE
jgi:hypothetical protein